MSTTGSANRVRLEITSEIPIIETHQHISERGTRDRTFGWSGNHIEEILAAMEKFSVQAAVLQPLGGAVDPIGVHRAIAEYSKAYPGRIFGIASLNIKEFGVERTVSELEYCVKELGFVGIKLHGFSHGINPTSDLGRVYFEAARALKVPLMVCVGAHGQPFTSPTLYSALAREYPDVTIIFAHLDYVIAEAAIAIAQERENIYLSSSLAIPAYLKLALEKLGGERMMLASEDSWSIGAEIAKFLATGVSDSVLEKVFYETPCKVFQLKERVLLKTA